MPAKTSKPLLFRSQTASNGLDFAFWLDVHVLSLGDSLREKIEEGLAASRFGVVIISSAFLSKRWPTRELNGLTVLEDDGAKVILPIWHKISKEQLAQHSPILADRLAADTSRGIASVASEIVDVIVYQSNSPATTSPTLARMFVKLLQAGPIAEDIAEFLRYHRKILTSAFGWADVGQLVFSAKEGYTFFGVKGYTARTITVYGLAFGPSCGPLFKDSCPVEWLGDLIECVKTSNLQNVAFSREPGWDIEYERTVILAGRRDDFSNDDQASLRQLNKLLDENGIKVRSYDWLIDACLQIQGRERGS